jgi:hypothetical protein
VRVQATYTLTELANAARLTRRRIERMLRSANVPIHKQKRGTLIYASELQAQMPLLWASLLALSGE